MITIIKLNSNSNFVRSQQPEQLFLHCGIQHWYSLGFKILTQYKG